MAWPVTYTASDKRPVPERIQPHEAKFFLHVTAEHLEFLDILVYIHIRMVTMHEYKTIMRVFIASVQEIIVSSM